MSDYAALRAVGGFIFDMDGVIYRGDVVLPGAVKFIEAMRRARIPFLFLTNNSTTPAAKVTVRLEGMGIPISPDEVMTSADVTADMLAEQMPGRRVLVVGEEGIREALLRRGFKLTDEHEKADAVVVGLDRQLTYHTLQEACLAVRRGAALVATNSDRTLPTPFGLIPGAGSLVAALETATDVEARVYGKPSPEMYLHALPRLGTAPEETAAVGDRPDTDIIGGQRAGLRTVGVLTGVGTPETFAAMQPPPDWLFPGLPELYRAYFGED